MDVKKPHGKFPLLPRKKHTSKQHYGHVLVIPKKEIDYIFDIDDTDLAEMMIFAKSVAKALKSAVACKRIGIAVIGLEVPHAHIHLVPMNTVGDLNFSRPKLKPTQEELIEVTTKIRKAYEEDGNR